MKPLTRLLWLAGALLVALLVVVLTYTGPVTAAEPDAKKPAKFPELPENHEVATLAGGCFWCVEEVIRQQPGVLAVLSGYAGGRPETANYKMVCSGLTKHAEVVQVYYDPEKIDFDGVLKAFWDSHNPTHLNRQGNDRGPQYRSAIFYHNEEQKKKAEASIAKLNASGKYSVPAVTTLEKFEKLYPAESYHQDYFELNPNDPYCQNVLVPKLKKLGLDYPGKPKDETTQKSTKE